MVQRVRGGAAKLALQHGFADLKFAGAIAGLCWVSLPLRTRKSNRVLCQRHIKLIENQVDMQLIVEIEAQLTVELFALGVAVCAVTICSHGAVVGQNTHRADGVAKLVVGTVQAVGPHVILVAHFCFLGRGLTKGLDHAAGGISIQLC